MDIKFALQRPFTDIKKLLIGILLSILPIVNIFSFGYQLECARLTLKKKKDLPEWTNWRELFIHGIYFYLIAMIYLIPFVVISVFLIGKELFERFMADKGSFEIITNLEAVRVFTWLLLMLFTLYFLFGALVTYSSNFKFKEAFDFKKMSKKIFTGKYVGAALATLLISFALDFAFSFIPLIPVGSVSYSIGGPIAGFISGVMGFTLMAESFR